MNDETERIKRARVDRSFVTLGGIDFLVRRPVGEDWQKAIQELLKACEELQAMDPSDEERAIDQFWRRLIADHVPGLEANYFAVKDKVTLRELSAAASVAFGIPLDLDRNSRDGI
jgi:hypothetical protein